MAFQAQGLDHVALVVSDMERSIAWYEDVPAMERRFADVWDGQGDPVVLCNGDACVALFAGKLIAKVKPGGVYASVVDAPQNAADPRTAEVRALRPNASR